MDLNYLFHRHQVSLMMAAGAGGVEAQAAHAQLARRYAARIATTQAGTGVQHPFATA